MIVPIGVFFCRLKHILRELQTQHSVLSDAEKSFGKELTLMETRLSHFSDQIERVWFLYILLLLPFMLSLIK